MAITHVDLPRIPDGKITSSGVRVNVSAEVEYTALWLRGRGALPMHHLMEEAATAELSRSQLWQWSHHSFGVLNDGRKVTAKLFEEKLQDELTEILANVGTEAYASGHYEATASVPREIALADEFKTFLTWFAYTPLP